MCWNGSTEKLSLYLCHYSLKFFFPFLFCVVNCEVLMVSDFSHVELSAFVGCCRIWWHFVLLLIFYVVGDARALLWTYARYYFVVAVVVLLLMLGAMKSTLDLTLTATPMTKTSIPNHNQEAKIVASSWDTTKCTLKHIYLTQLCAFLFPMILLYVSFAKIYLQIIRQTERLIPFTMTVRKHVLHKNDMTRYVLKIV